jgi:hypothetical protein
LSAPLQREWWRHGDRREQALLLLLFIATRVALSGLGLRFKLDLSWMFLADLVDLRERLAETVFYFHAFAPGMNLLTGLLLKLAPAHVAVSAAALFWAFGALLTLCLFRILKALGLARWSAFALALGFSLLPQTLYLENLYLYNYLCAALLCLIAVLFQRALTRTSAAAWFWFFLACTSLGWLYTAFHLLWYVLMLAVALGVATRGTRRRVWMGALAPTVLLLALYVKNYAVFGVFGATSWGGANLTLATTQQMRPAERKRWIEAGHLSPYAAVNAYAPPSEYLWLFPELPRFPWPGSNELMRSSVNAGNFNHGLFLEVNRERGKDAAYYIQTRPTDYLRRVFTQNLPSLFHGTTHWHPHDRRPVSPHSGHRAVLGSYERLYDELVHRWPVPNVGLFAFLPIFYVWGLVRSITQLRSPERDVRAAGALLGLCLTQIAYVVAVSSMATSWEASRYRYSIEPCIWIVVALGFSSVYQRARKKWRPGSRSAAPPDTSGQIA